jgi:hypothetical protein
VAALHCTALRCGGTALHCAALWRHCAALWRHCAVLWRHCTALRCAVAALRCAVAALRCGSQCKSDAVHHLVVARFGTGCCARHGTTRCPLCHCQAYLEATEYGSAPMPLHVPLCPTAPTLFTKRLVVALDVRSSLQQHATRQHTARQDARCNKTRCEVQQDKMRGATRQDARCNKTRCEIKVQRRERLAALDGRQCYVQYT